MFKVLKQSKKSGARTCRLATAHGSIATPFFMPIATKGAVKNISVTELKELKAQIVLANTYHLYLQPGLEIIKKQQGLHKLMNWNQPILSDSGGYQVFSLAKMRKIKPEGVEFQSHLDGSRHFLTPEKSIMIQQTLGVDIMMAFDVCPDGQASLEKIKEACALTYDWAKKCKKQWRQKKNKQLLFGIIQGGIYPQLREQSLKDITSLDFSGYALGGLAVGEDRQDMYRVLKHIVKLLPVNKPRYLMGLGRPEEIVFAVEQGIDMFDCVIPTREARHGRLYQFCTQGTKGAIKLWDNVYYRTLIIKNEKFKLSKEVINSSSKIKLLKEHTKAYLHHLFKTEEGLGLRLATLNNLEFYLDLMVRLRGAVKNNKI